MTRASDMLSRPLKKLCGIKARVPAPRLPLQQLFHDKPLAPRGPSRHDDTPREFGLFLVPPRGFTERGDLLLRFGATPGARGTGCVSGGLLRLDRTEVQALLEEPGVPARTGTDDGGCSARLGGRCSPMGPTRLDESFRPQLPDHGALGSCGSRGFAAPPTCEETVYWVR